MFNTENLHHHLQQHQQHNAVVTQTQSSPPLLPHLSQQHTLAPGTSATSTTLPQTLLQATTPNVAASTSGLSYIQQHQQPHTLNQLNAHQHQQQLHVASTLSGTHSAVHTSTTQTPTPLFDTRHLQHNATAAANVLDKTTYLTSAPTFSSNNNQTGRFYTAGSSTANGITSATHPNTILITNNFTQQQLPPSVSTTPPRTSISQASLTTGNYTNNSNIRILSTTTTSPNTLQHIAAPSHQQHVFNINSSSHNMNKEVHHPPFHSNDGIQLQDLYQQPQALLQTQNFTPTPLHHHMSAALLPQHSIPHFAQQHFSPSTSLSQHQHGAMHLQLPTAAQQFYISTDSTAMGTGTAATSSTVKVMPSLSTLTNAIVTRGGAVPNIVAATTAAPSTITTPAANNSTVVLDRINICINNHYTDSSGATASLAGGIGSPASSQQQQQQPSPIIPAIQHKAVIDSINGLLIDPYASNESTLIIDEPDSTTTTTTPHTPPTTPESSSPIASNINTAKVQSPTATTTKHLFTVCSEVIEIDEDDEDDEAEVEEDDEEEGTSEISVSTKESSIQNQGANPQLQPQQGESKSIQPPPLTQLQPLISSEGQHQQQQAIMLTPPSPKAPSLIGYSIGEDVFIKRQDGRFYIGTVIDSARQQFLVRFDDKSELWCGLDEMRKLGGGSSSPGDGNASIETKMCVACKRAQRNDVVETCERCGRGYHRNCTAETSTGSGVWLCRRCNKPMKVSSISEERKASVCRQLPYHVDTLNWDEKHRVNDEQIYCYCGQSGRFYDNMLQCCKCRNWFHTQCMQCFESKILRGDCFFVFCCSVCNEGVEFLRRLRMNWIDLVHLALYNLSVMKKQHIKYHHLMKDILPFILEKRRRLPIPKEWINMTGKELLENIKCTLKQNSDRFICGREVKRDNLYYALRNNGPPILPKINVSMEDVLCDELLLGRLKLTLLKGAIENRKSSSIFSATATNVDDVVSKSAKADIYEFRCEDDEKFTSDDEIPIKHILEKAKKNATTPTINKFSTLSTTKPATTVKSLSIHGGGINISKTYTTNLDIIDMNDENANDANCNDQTLNEKSPQEAIISTETKQDDDAATAAVAVSIAAEATAVAISMTKESGKRVETSEKSSRKRKAFTLSKTYKEIAAEAAAKRYDRCNRICDSSSDENSSSSRGTSLDLIIPPPKDFLGLNNPFRMVTPKKNAAEQHGPGRKSTIHFGGFGRNSGIMIKNSILNTTTLDFSSKLAALRSAGIFPNLSTSNLAKAAGQQRTVRTIKRRLSAKDITIGPNQEVRRRRTRRLSSNVEVISTTTINPIPSSFFPIHAKDLISLSHNTMTKAAPTPNAHKITHHQNSNQPAAPPPLPPPLLPHISSSSSSSAASSVSSSPPASTSSSVDSLSTIQHQQQTTEVIPPAPPSKLPTHGRRLRQRPPKNSPCNSRRSSISGTSTSSNQSAASISAATGATLHAAAAAAAAATTTNNTNGDKTMQDLKESVNKYFGAANRIESGEQFCIRAKRQLPNGQWQYLIEWGDAMGTHSTTTTSYSSVTSVPLNNIIVT